MKAKKSLGQNFLIDNNVINKIVDVIDANENDLIIEIGPGRGALSRLLKKKANVIAYELDSDLKSILDKIEDDKFKVIYKDFLKSNIVDDIKDIKYDRLFIVGNLPYYITTPIIEHIIDCNVDFSKLVVMVQREVADRFTASCGCKDYGYITLVLKYYFEIKKIIDVSKYAFNPVPKVESTVLEFRKKIKVDEIDEEKYFAFLKDAFRQKRKTLKNNLKDYNWDKVWSVLNKYGMNDTVRAEELDEHIFREIFDVINRKNKLL